MRAAPQVKHPYIWRKPGVCGGEPVIRGTRISVGLVVEHIHRLRMTPQRVARLWDHVALAQVYDALSYNHDHKAEIDRHIRAHRRAARPRKLST